LPTRIKMLIYCFHHLQAMANHTKPSIVMALFLLKLYSYSPMLKQLRSTFSKP